MSKAILISIKPKYLAKILNGEKTIEIRKTMPKCDLPIDVYIYCTKDKQILKQLVFKSWHNLGGYTDYEKINGKVVAKFTLNRIRTNDMTNCLQGSCLSYAEVNKYTKGKKFYGWVIDNLKIFEEPKELNEFWYCTEKHCFFSECHKYMHCRKYLKRPPQSWQYVEVTL